MKRMLNRGWNHFFHGLDKKTIGIITILAISDLFVFSGVLYLRYIIPNFNEYLGVDQSQFDYIIAIYGFLALFSRIPGGWLADRFSAKKLLTLSLVIIGLCGLWWTLTIQLDITVTARLTQLYIIYFLWGIAIPGLFWSPLWKLVSQNVKKEQQGTAYGLQGSILGFFGVILIAVGATVVTTVTKNLQNNFGNNSAVSKIPFLVFAYFICTMVLFMAIMAWMFIPNKQKEIEKINWKLKIFDLFKPMKFLRVWLCGIFVFGMYMFQSTFAYYMKDVLSQVGISIGLVTILGGIRSYGLRFLVSSPIGRAADKWKSYVLGLVFILLFGLILCCVFTIIPGWGQVWFLNSPVWIKILFQLIMCVLFILIGSFGWALLTLRFVQVGELPMEKNSYANTISVISWIAFTPDAWFNYAASAIGKIPGNYKEGEAVKNYSLQGLQILLLIAIGCVIVGLACGYIIYLINKKEVKKLGKASFRWRELGNI